MAISPPTHKLWWNEKIHRVELIWIAVAFTWGLVMFFMMIYWHATGRQNLSTETYRTTHAEATEDFACSVARASGGATRSRTEPAASGSAKTRQTENLFMECDLDGDSISFAKSPLAPAGSCRPG